MTEPHEAWLEKATDDLCFAAIGLKEGFHSQVCFLSQQAIEKSLKGCLVKLGRSYPKNHNLRELAKLTPELPLKSFLEQITVMDGYYIPIRYPDAAPGMKASGPPNETEAALALDTAKQILETVRKFLEVP